MAGTVSRFIGAGVGFARLVEVSSVKVVDMGRLYSVKGQSTSQIGFASLDELYATC
jgi:hypothetical protein